VGRVTRAVGHLCVEDIDARIKRCTEPWRLRRWQVMRCALVNPRPAAELALEAGLARQPVHNVAAADTRQGPQVLETPGRGQRQRAYLRLVQDQAAVERFVKKGARGQVSAGVQLNPAREKAAGQRVHTSTVSRVLTRPQGRKVVPRPRHPQSSAQEQAAFKKTSPRK
jgi:hypothetical protein